MQALEKCWSCGRVPVEAATCGWCGVWLARLTGERVGSWAGPLLALARRWGIPDDALREAAIDSASRAELEALRLGLAGSAGGRLYDWLGSEESLSLVNCDEYGALTALTMAADSAKLKMRRGARPPQAGDADRASSAGSEALTESAHAEIPVATVNALRLGQVLVAEVPAPIGRRAWVAIRPASEPEDAAAQQQGWKRSSRARRFSVRHAEYLVEHLDGLDYDMGMRQVADARVAGEAALWRLLAGWGVAPSELDYPWRSDFPE